MIQSYSNLAGILSPMPSQVQPQAQPAQTYQPAPTPSPQLTAQNAIGYGPVNTSPAPALTAKPAIGYGPVNTSAPVPSGSSMGPMQSGSSMGGSATSQPYGRQFRRFGGPQGQMIEGRFPGLQQALLQQKQVNQFGGPGTENGVI